jgi:hypothetical protein
VACSINIGAQSISDDHRNVGNAPGVPCAITALGDFDPDNGGHLVLFDLKLIIRFPPGSTILIRSASLRHGNLRIQPGETRYSVIQYAAGRLARHVSYGFKTQAKLTRAEVLRDEQEAPS